jgi:hypothetical protein
MTIGKKGSTVVFSIPNLELNGNVLSWDSFKFYTPVGDLDDGFKYFNIPADSITIERDTSLYKEVIVYCVGGVVSAQGFYEGEDVSLPSFDLRGDHLFTVKIPSLSDPGEITIEQREVIDDSN